MLIIIGKTASGKDTVVKELVKNGYHKMVTYTTRPIRIGEIPGVSYHYISNNEFIDKISSGFFAEYKSYDTIDGMWYYGSAKEDYEKADDKTVTILTPQGFGDIRAVIQNDLHCVYLRSSEETIRKRLNLRGDHPKEIERRIKSDEKDFTNVQQLADYVIDNEWNTNLQSIVRKIMSLEEGDYTPLG